MNNSLEIENLCCGYGKKLILDSIRLTVPEGDFVTLIGPNGSGKTTLIRAITGMLPPHQGSIRIEGEENHRLNYRERARKLAVVNQTTEATGISVEDYVLMGRLPHRHPMQFFETARDRAIAKENLHLTGIWEMREKYMNQLSGGEQQLAAIARALTQQTGIILLDEPTSHLDISHQVKILELVRQLNQTKRITVLLVIHDLNLASEFSRRLVLLHHGKIHATGTPQEVLTTSHIEAVYHARVITQPNPTSGKPFIFPITGTSTHEQ